MESLDQNRRSEDRDRALNERLDRMDRENQSLSHQVTALEASVQIVKLEQLHLKELIDSRFKAIEKSQELQLSETKSLSAMITAMADDPGKSPAGRSLHNLIATVAQTVDVHSIKLEEHSTVHQEILKWQDQVNGVLGILKWVGAGGVVAVIIEGIRLLKYLP